MRGKENYVYIALSIVALLLFSLMNYIKGGAFDFDEAFSLAMIEHSFGEIWAITARDFHPPLSYFILKVLSWFLAPFSVGNLEIYRLTAILGYFSVILLCIFPIRRLWGFRTSVIAIVLFMLMPISFYIYSNFRMYAWAAPLVLATFVYAFDSFQNNSKWAWAKLTAVSCAAMYIHYYALISTFVVYVLLLLIIVLARRADMKKQLKSYFVSGLALVLLYAPWLYFFIGQLAEVKNDYWIENPGISDYIYALQFYFVPKYYTEKYVDLLSSSWMLVAIPVLLVLTVVIVVLAYSRFRKKGKYKLSIYVSAAAFASLLIALAMVMIYTFMVSPVYHIRYLMCYFGLFVLGLSLCINVLLEEKKMLNNLIVGAFAVLLLFDFGLCMCINIVRSNFGFSSKNEVNIADATIKTYYADESAFPDMAYISVLSPQNEYYLVTDDNPDTREIIAPYVVNDTITTAPFLNVKKVETLDVDHAFYYMTKQNPLLDSTFCTQYVVMDSVYSGLYRVEPIKE